MSQHPKKGAVVQEGPLPAEVYAKEGDTSSSSLGLEVTVMRARVCVCVCACETDRRNLSASNLLL